MEALSSMNLAKNQEVIQRVRDEINSLLFQDELLWRQRSSCSRTSFENAAKDIFSVGCVLAELHLGKPLFDSTSLVMYLESGILPGLIQELPPHTKVVVEACIQKDWMRYLFCFFKF